MELLRKLMDLIPVILAKLGGISTSLALLQLTCVGVHIHSLGQPGTGGGVVVVEVVVVVASGVVNSAVSIMSVVFLRDLGTTADSQTLAAMHKHSTSAALLQRIRANMFADRCFLRGSCAN